MFERYTTKLLLSPKTKIGEYVFDVYMSVSHQLSNQITEHPVQYGANVSDHILNQPDIITFQIGMSDCSQDLIAGQFSTPFMRLKNLHWYEGESATANIRTNFRDVIAAPFKDAYARYRMNLSPFPSRSVNAFSRLQEMKLKGEVFDCATRLGTYKDMVIKDIQANDDVSTRFGLMATVTCQQIFRTSVEKVVVESTYQIQGETNSGVQNSRPLESVIHYYGGLLPALTAGTIGG